MIYVYDDLLPNFNYYYDNVKKTNFKDVVSQGITYRDISQEVLPVLIYDQLSKRIPRKPKDVLSFLRAYRDNPEQKNPTWIHSDALFSEWIGIFMVQPSEYPQDDGVTVWTNNDLGCHGYYLDDHKDPQASIIDEQSLDPEKWTIYKRVEFKPNRLVMMPAHYFHSKGSYRNCGKTYDDCRIVHVLFFNMGETNV